MHTLCLQGCKATQSARAYQDLPISALYSVPLVKKASAATNFVPMRCLFDHSMKWFSCHPSDTINVLFVLEILILARLHKFTLLFA